MTDRTPIPPEEFTDAVDRLDRDALAGFVARLEAAAADGATVDVDPPIVTIRDGDTRRRLAVAPRGVDADADGVGVDADDIDAVVTATPPSDAPDAAVRTPAHLRRRLLYALPPDDADAIAEEWLDVPARAASYAPPAGAGGVGDEADPASDQTSGPDPGPDSTATATPGTGPADPSGSQPSPPDGPGESESPAGGPGPSDGSDGSKPAERDRTVGGWTAAQAAVVVALVAVLLGGVGGVVYAAEMSPDGDAGAFADAAAVNGEGLSEAEIRRRSRGSIDGSGGVSTATTPTPSAGGEGSGMPVPADVSDTDRNVRPAPNCERSAIHVVQIQMNALKHNNNTTNDGIRTVRRFASPRNRQTIETLDEFVRTVKSPTYRPMLSYDSIQYTPFPVGENFAQVRVTTLENGNTTGSYYFRLRMIDDSRYDGCWMTDSVVPVDRTRNVSG